MKQEWIIVHMPTGETVKEGFPTERLAYQWLFNNIARLQPSDKNQYAVEKVEEDEA